jgi:6,7-dimethyl-8-ribityllumazine synthase
MKTHEGKFDTSNRRFAIVASRFNDYIVESLVRGARGTLGKLGVAEDAIEAFWVPGAFEIPGVALRVAASGDFDAVICLGCVIRGSTPHFDYVAGECARGIAELAATSEIPVIFGVLTTETLEQAIERAGTKAGNKGSDAALAAVEMANLYSRLDESSGVETENPGEGAADA